MKNSNEIELPELNIERNGYLLLAYTAFTLSLIYLDYTLLNAMNPWGFLVMVPASLFGFHLLWFMLRPFAMVFKDRVEVKPTLFGNKVYHFIDVKKITEDKKGRLFLTYKDGEIEKLNLLGIKTTHISMLKQVLEENITHL